MERTLVIVKPDAVQRGLIGPILARLERRGLRFAALKLMQITPELAARHYAVHKGKPFYDTLIEFITSGPVQHAVGREHKTNKPYVAVPIKTDGTRGYGTHLGEGGGAHTHR